MSSYSQDFPFGIMDVVELLHLRVREETGEQCVCGLSILRRPSGKNECELHKKCLEM